MYREACWSSLHSGEWREWCWPRIKSELCPCLSWMDGDGTSIQNLLATCADLVAVRGCWTCAALTEVGKVSRPRSQAAMSSREKENMTCFQETIVERRGFFFLVRLHFTSLWKKNSKEKTCQKNSNPVFAKCNIKTFWLYAHLKCLY